MIDFKQYYKAVNKKVLIKIKSDKNTLSNGITYQEARGKKDVVEGMVILSQPSLKIPEKALVWFPIFAALPINLDGEQCVIVDYEDLYLIENTDM